MIAKPEEIELLPCPFCGYEASMTQHESAGGGGRMIWVVGCRNEDCEVTFQGHARKVDAAKAWNDQRAIAILDEILPYYQDARPDTNSWGALRAMEGIRQRLTETERDALAQEAI